MFNTNEMDNIIYIDIINDIDNNRTRDKFELYVKQLKYKIFIAYLITGFYIFLFLVCISLYYYFVINQ